VSYIRHVLQPGETIRYQGSVRWILYLQALLLAVVGAAASLFYVPFPARGPGPTRGRQNPAWAAPLGR